MVSATQKNYIGVFLDTNKLKDIFTDTCTMMLGREADGSVRTILLIENKLAYDVMGYIIRQINPESSLGYTDLLKNQKLLIKARQDLFILVWINHYFKEDGSTYEPLEKDPIFTSADNLLCLLYTRVELGRDRALELEKIKASQNVSQIVTR